MGGEKWFGSQRGRRQKKANQKTSVRIMEGGVGKNIGADLGLRCPCFHRELFCVAIEESKRTRTRKRVKRRMMCLEAKKVRSNPGTSKRNS